MGFLGDAAVFFNRTIVHLIVVSKKQGSSFYDTDIEPKNIAA
jgi:hypothetical protein